MPTAAASAFLRARTMLRVVGGFRTGLAGLLRRPSVAAAVCSEGSESVSIDLSCGRVLSGEVDKALPISVPGLSVKVAEIGEKKCCCGEVGENVVFVGEVGVRGTRRGGTGGIHRGLGGPVLWEGRFGWESDVRMRRTRSPRSLSLVDSCQNEDG